ncbi:MAG: tetratricopeptide repeat protein [Sumerlaeia bacterium]
MDAKLLAKHLQDFQSGRNPKAYLPIIGELRKQRRFTEALEICSAGIEGDPQSSAGKINYVRLLIDVNRIADANRELQKLEQKGEERTLGYLQEKIRCSIKLRDLATAKEKLNELIQISPFDPVTQQLQSEVHSLGLNTTLDSSQPSVNPSYSKTPEATLDILRESLNSVSEVIAMDFFDLHAGRFIIRQNDDLLESAIQLHEEVTQSSIEMGTGMVHFSLLEMQEIIFFVVRRGGYLLFIALDQGVNFGKIQHRVFLILDRHLPLKINKQNNSVITQINTSRGGL